MLPPIIAGLGDSHCRVPAPELVEGDYTDMRIGGGVLALIIIILLLVWLL